MPPLSVGQSKVRCRIRERENRGARAGEQTRPVHPSASAISRRLSPRNRRSRMRRTGSSSPTPVADRVKAKYRGRPGVTVLSVSEAIGTRPVHQPQSSLRRRTPRSSGPRTRGSRRNSCRSSSRGGDSGDSDGGSDEPEPHPAVTAGRRVGSSLASHRPGRRARPWPRSPLLCKTT